MRVCYKKSPLTNTRSHATPRRPRAPQSVFIGRGQPLGCIPGLGRPWGRLRGSLATSSTPPRSAGRPVVPRGPCRPVSEIRENIENSQILSFFKNVPTVFLSTLAMPTRPEPAARGPLGPPEDPPRHSRPAGPAQVDQPNQGNLEKSRKNAKISKKLKK